jgi:hypothetical protein
MAEVAVARDGCIEDEGIWTLIVYVAEIDGIKFESANVEFRRPGLAKKTG